VDKYAQLVSPAHIAQNEFNLNIPRYVDTFEESEAVDLKAIGAERVRLKQELAMLEDQMAGYLKALGYEDANRSENRDAA
jgi:type I restriction enzyme M protein